MSILERIDATTCSVRLLGLYVICSWAGFTEKALQVQSRLYEVQASTSLCDLASPVSTTKAQLVQVSQHYRGVILPVDISGLMQQLLK
jgi:hypothetical protein